MALFTDHCGCEPKLIAKGTGECLVRAVCRVEGDSHNIPGTIRQRPGRFGQAAATQITHNRMPGRFAEGSRHVVTGHASNARDVVKRDIAGKVAFDKPERFSDRVHANSRVCADLVCPLLLQLI